MKSLQITTPGKAEIIDLEEPRPAAGEALLSIEAVATCPHWDRHIYEGDPMFEGHKLDYPYWPGQPGHEAIGRVEAVGDGVDEGLVGRRVAVWRAAQPYMNGLYATHGIVDAERLLRIQEDLSAEKVTSLELAMCVQVSIDQLSEINAIAGKRILLGGLGPGGIVGLQLLKAAGAAEVVAIDPVAERRELALQLGADAAVPPGDPLVSVSRSGPDAFDAALDTTGLKVSIEALMNACKRAVAIFGVLREYVSLGPAQWYGGFFLIAYGEHNRGAAGRAYQGILDGQLDLTPLFSQKMPPSQYNKAVGPPHNMPGPQVLFH
ncbi:MAG: zinc-binding dehydrogenase, partial [Puniceicoccaceae bacterium]